MSGVHSLRALKALDVKVALQNLLDWSLRQRLDSELPGHYTVPTGSRIAIRYHEDNPPALAVRMQEMFGEATTPSIAEGRVPVVLELLSPAHRPLQITRDLGAFWAGATVKCKRDERALSQTCLAGRSGEYGTDTADEEIFVRGVRPDALTPTLPQEREKSNFERFLLSQVSGRNENRAFAPERCGEKHGGE